MRQDKKVRRVPIVVNDYKIPAFKEKLAAEGFEIYKIFPVIKGTTCISIITKEWADVVRLHKVCVGLNEELRLDKPKNGKQVRDKKV